MRYGLWTLLVLGTIALPVLAALQVLPRFGYTNCGGNNAAQSDVRMYLALAHVAAMNSPTEEFAVELATLEERQHLAQIADDLWLGGGGFLVCTKPIRFDESARPRVVIVCDRAFTNVPRYVFGTAPPTHAIGLSDGSTALISAKEFAAMDKSSFVPLAQILAR
jgi:hypothetical protein